MVSRLVLKEKALAQGELDPKHQKRWHEVLHRTCDGRRENPEKVAFELRPTDVQPPCKADVRAPVLWRPLKEPQRLMLRHGPFVNAQPIA